MTTRELAKMLDISLNEAQGLIEDDPNESSFDPFAIDEAEIIAAYATQLELPVFEYC